MEKGVVFTNQNCIGCNRCVSVCPVPTANRAIRKNGKGIVLVIPENCIHCGNCINICQHNAREYIDDTEDFFRDLKNGESISVAVSSDFFTNYGDKAGKVLGYLKALGVKEFFNTSLGADIASWAYSNYINSNPDKAMYSTQCTAIVNYIERCRPELLPKLMPIHSPLMCLAIYVKKYLKLNDRIAFISPCIAKKDEIESFGSDKLVHYNVTFKHLVQKLKLANIDRYPAINISNSSSIGNIFQTRDGFRENISNYLQYRGNILQLTNIKKLQEDDSSLSNIFNSDIPLIVDAMQCDQGCLMGTGTEKKIEAIRNSMQVHNKIIKKIEDTDMPIPEKPDFTPQQIRLERLNKKFFNMDIKDFYRTYTDRYQQSLEIPEDIYDEIFNVMHKHSEASRNINCQSCGYSTCKKMPFAIASGFNSIDNCIQYENTENMLLYTTDSLTGLPNKIQLLADLKEMAQDNAIANFAYVQFSIKDIRIYYNIYGYDATNKIVTFTSAYAKSLLKEGEKLYNTGDNDFIAILHKPSLNSFISKMNETVKPSLNANDDSIVITICSGTYQSENPQEEPDSIIKKLMTAFSFAKEAKDTDRKDFEENIMVTKISAIPLTKQLEEGFLNREFFVMYQPKVNIKTKMLQGAEALIRWKHNGTIVPPGEFIPLCESTGFVRRLDFYMLNRVCATMKKWQSENIGPLVPISVNFSKKHFERKEANLLERIINVVDSFQIEHRLIDIELTETVYSDSSDDLNKVICGLKNANFSSSIDDFGSGYSSLNLLQNLEFNVLKLDKSLVDTLLTSPRANTVVASVIDMAKNLGMTIVAEGVENAETSSLLQNLNCDMIQGYFFDKPLSEEDFKNRLMNKQYC